MTTDQILEQMQNADPGLYERVLDTPGFAIFFSRLCDLARRADDITEAVVAERGRCAKVAEAYADRVDSLPEDALDSCLEDENGPFEITPTTWIATASRDIADRIRRAP